MKFWETQCVYICLRILPPAGYGEIYYDFFSAKVFMFSVAAEVAFQLT